MCARLARQCSLLLVANILFLLPSPLAAAANSVERHPDLPPAVTVWCLGNPARFGLAARAFGMEAGDSSEPDEFTRNKETVPLSEWAASDKRRDVEDFDRACRTAFIAFRHAGLGLALYGLEPGQLGEALEGNSGSSDEIWSGLGGVLVGAALTGIGGAAAGRRRAHHEDAEELRRLDAEFRSSLELHVVQPKNAEVARQARVQARVLRDAVREWTPSGLAETLPTGISGKEVRAATDILDELLDGEPPRIGNFRHENSREREEDVNILLGKAANLHLQVAKIADGISDFLRKGGREP